MPLILEKLFSLPPRHGHLLELHLTLVSLWMMFSENPNPHFGEHQAEKTKIECEWGALLENGTLWKIKPEVD
jgi:hypothetical protein